MDRNKVFLVAAVAIAWSSASPAAGESSAKERFELWNDCKPVPLLIKLDGGESGLAEEDVALIVRSRLRAARLYYEDGSGIDEVGNAFLNVFVQSVGDTFVIRMELVRFLEFPSVPSLPDPPMLGDMQLATTWMTGGFGFYGGDRQHTLSKVSQSIDTFIDDYLRANADAC